MNTTTCPDWCVEHFESEPGDLEPFRYHYGEPVEIPISEDASYAPVAIRLVYREDEGTTIELDLPTRPAGFTGDEAMAIGEQLIAFGQRLNANPNS